MKSFFKNFNFARFIILACLLGSIGLGYWAYDLYQKNETLREALSHDGDVETTVGRLMQNSLTYSELSKERRSESLFGEQADVVSYVRRIAFGDNIDIGEVNVSSTPRPVNKGVTDLTYKITPNDPDQSFQRTAIANFLFTLEDSSARVRVTEVQIDTAEKKLRPEEIPAEDKWRFSATATSRQKKGE